jgi:hypothetical protein
MKTLFGNTLIVIGATWLLVGCATDKDREPGETPSTSSVAPGDAPSEITIRQFKTDLDPTELARWPEVSQSDEFRGAIDRGDLEGFCASFGFLMDANFDQPWRLTNRNANAPHSGCAVMDRPPDNSFMCCPCKHVGPVHPVCRNPEE